MNKLNQSVATLSSFIARTMLDNKNWQMFGFKSRPKRGRIFDRFISDARLAKEKFVLNELLLFSMADIVQAIKTADLEETNKLLYLVGILSTIFTGRAFEDEKEYFAFIQTGIRDYSGHNFIKTFAARAEKAVGKESTKSLIAGVVVLEMLKSNSQGVGLIYDKQVLSQQVCLEIGEDHLDFPLDNSKLKEYTDFSLALLSSR